MSKNDITISPKYGVNPCMPLCFFCREPKGEIALLGRIWERDKNGRKVRNSDVEAPKEAVLDYELCDRCKKNFEDNKEVLILEVSDEVNGLPIADNMYPTGRYSVISDKDFFEGTNAKTVPPKRIGLMLANN